MNTTITTTKEFIVSTEEIKCSVDTIETDTLKDARAKILEEVDEYTPPPPWAFCVNGLIIGKKQEEKKLAWNYCRRAADFVVELVSMKTKEKEHKIEETGEDVSSMKHDEQRKRKKEYSATQQQQQQHPSSSPSSVVTVLSSSSNDNEDTTSETAGVWKRHKSNNSNGCITEPIPVKSEDHAACASTMSSRYQSDDVKQYNYVSPVPMKSEDDAARGNKMSSSRHQSDGVDIKTETTGVSSSCNGIIGKEQEKKNRPCQLDPVSVKSESILHDTVTTTTATATTRKKKDKFHDIEERKDLIDLTEETDDDDDDDDDDDVNDDKKIITNGDDKTRTSATIEKQTTKQSTSEETTSTTNNKKTNKKNMNDDDGTITNWIDESLSALCRSDDELHVSSIITPDQNVRRRCYHHNYERKLELVDVTIGCTTSSPLSSDMDDDKKKEEKNPYQSTSIVINNNFAAAGKNNTKIGTTSNNNDKTSTIQKLKGNVCQTNNNTKISAVPARQQSEKKSNDDDDEKRIFSDDIVVAVPVSITQENEEVTTTVEDVKKEIEIKSNTNNGDATTFDDPVPLQSSELSCQHRRGEAVALPSNNQEHQPAATLDHNGANTGTNTDTDTDTGAKIVGMQKKIIASEHAGCAKIPIKEETRKKFASERNDSYRKYGDKFLLHRHNKLGIARLGGSHQTTDAYPASTNPILLDPMYPKPTHIVEGSNYNKDDYMYFTCDTMWHPNGPMYAGQKTAALDFFIESDRSFPLFMKRTLTGLHRKTQGHLIGWEYVGNYKSIQENEVPFWESANNFTEASKNVIAKKTYESSLRQSGYGKNIITTWRERLIEEIQKDKNENKERTTTQSANTLAARCLKEGFEPTMSDKDLMHVLVRLDEYHEQYMIQFAFYDERIYQFCVEGKTNHTKDGTIIRTTNGSAATGTTKENTSATANDWYEFAEQNMLFKY